MKAILLAGATVFVGLAIVTFVQIGEARSVVQERARKPAQAWVKLAGCHYLQQNYNDGDSFHVRWDQQEFVFRLYFVDAPEIEESRSSNGKGKPSDRSLEQSKYFGVTVQQNSKAGLEAKEFVQRSLQRPFIIWTRWKSAMGMGHLPRYYALIEVDGKSLAEELVSRGLARAKGVVAILPDGTPAKVYMEKLRSLEAEAREKRRGIWAESTDPKPIGRQKARTTSATSDKAGGLKL
jgi:endonuclease YncB( thermonuclease family)